ncbi:MAG TPA: nucleoside-diphosphate sugar epimerase/dehydratase [Devosiaceae bacterium]|nr:nucleoside-diphosphate sugar epimerase/dehydratase [Devosiaceae bacterium]
MIEDLRLSIGTMPRFWKRVIVICFDFVALCVALTLSYALRFSIWTIPARPDQYLVMVTAPLVAIPIFIRMGLYRAVIRYLPERALWTIVWAMAYAAIGWVVLAFLSQLAVHGYVPRSVPLFYWVLGVIFIAGSRFAAKRLLGPGTSPTRDRPAVLIYGAGSSGAQLAGTLARERGNFIVGFLDDNAHLQGRDVAGFRVYAPSYLPTLIGQHGVGEVILSLPSISFAHRQQIVARIGGHGVKIRTLPSLADVAQGKYLVNSIREFDIDELLGRSSVPPDKNLLQEMIEGRTIMVTGAGGSIGSELCRLIVRWRPQRLVLFEANEFALYQIDRELSALEDCALVPILGSVTDANVVRRAIGEHGVDAVFHAAAHKHVPLVEANALEGMRNNVLGTATVADVALASGVRHFVLISSDKAVRPTNVMGATKRWAELIVWQKSVEAMRRNSGQRFCSVRFGNVLGSNGSVVPLFKEQIANGGPVTLTDARMTRYFMSIHEAAELIVQASALSDGGDVFLLEMGEPILIEDLAENMIRLAGFSVRDEMNADGDIEIVVTGKRPGEKMFEELFYDKNGADSTRHPKILRAPRADSPAGNVNEALKQLTALLDRQDEAAARKLLFEFIQ